MEEITITVTTEDFIKGDYTDPDNCPLALALKRMFPEQANTLWVSPFFAFVNGQKYDLSKEDDNELRIRSEQENPEPLSIILESY